MYVIKCAFCLSWLLLVSCVLLLISCVLTEKLQNFSAFRYFSFEGGGGKETN